MALACSEPERRAVPREDAPHTGEPAGEEAAPPEVPVTAIPESPPEPTEPVVPISLPGEAPEAPAPATEPAPAPNPETSAPAEPTPGDPETAAPDLDEDVDEAPPDVPTLSLDELEHELRETRALGFLTRLALKNDIDDLLDAVRSFHEKGNGQLADLRERFDLLVMKVMSLLQDDDPDLALRIASAREALWKLLEDPREFAKLST